MMPSDEERVLAKAAEILKPESVDDWYQNRSIPGLGGITAKAAVEQGKADDVMRLLGMLEHGVW